LSQKASTIKKILIFPTQKLTPLEFNTTMLTAINSNIGILQPVKLRALLALIHCSLNMPITPPVSIFQ